jgi:hypothetical protein
VHQAGEKLFAGLRGAYDAAGVSAEVLPFIDDMAARYAWCDVLVCRSGAITVAEVAAAGIAAILFPLPWFVADEQAANAAFLADRGAGIAMKQLETTPAMLSETLRALTRARLLDMASKARASASPTPRAAARTSARRWRVRHKVKRIHFVGIGGSGMSGIAEVLANLGYTVSGSTSPRARRCGACGRWESASPSAQRDNVADADAVVTRPR